MNLCRLSNFSCIKFPDEFVTPNAAVHLAKGLPQNWLNTGIFKTRKLSKRPGPCDQVQPSCWIRSWFASLSRSILIRWARYPFLFGIRLHKAFSEAKSSLFIGFVCSRSSRCLLIQRLPIPNAAFHELRPLGY